MRLIPLPVNSALSALGGLALILAPLPLGFSLPAAIAGVVLGSIIVGLALDEVDVVRRDVSLAAHRGFALVIGVALALAALAVALAGDVVAGTVFSAAALAQLLLTVTTRYTAAY